MKTCLSIVLLLVLFLGCTVPVVLVESKVPVEINNTRDTVFVTVENHRGKPVPVLITNWQNSPQPLPSPNAPQPFTVQVREAIDEIKGPLTITFTTVTLRIKGTVEFDIPATTGSRIEVFVPNGAIVTAKEYQSRGFVSGYR